MDEPQEFRQIEAAGAPTRFARGWHCLGLSSSFQHDKPHEIKAFGDSIACPVHDWYEVATNLARPADASA